MMIWFQVSWYHNNAHITTSLYFHLHHHVTKLLVTFHLGNHNVSPSLLFAGDFLLSRGFVLFDMMCPARAQISFTFSFHKFLFLLSWCNFVAFNKSRSKIRHGVWNHIFWLISSQLSRLHNKSSDSNFSRWKKVYGFPSDWLFYYDTICYNNIQFATIAK